MRTRSRTRSVKKISFKSLAIFMAVLITALSLPLSVMAQGIEQMLNSSGEDDVTQKIYEIVEKRTATSKTFQLENGNYYLAEYDTAIHYLDENGLWQDIDNSLAVEGTDITNKSQKIKFAKKTTGNGELFSLHNGSNKLSISLDGANKKVRGKISNTEDGDTEDLTELQKMTSLKNISASVKYENILDGVDIEYIIKGEDLKENIIVKEKQNSYTYNFTMSLNGLTAVLSEEGEIEISNSSGERVYTIPAPFMWDSANAVSEDVEMSLAAHGNGKYSISISADSEWMNAADRVYPVTIDPPVYSGIMTNQVVDHTINSDQPNSGSYNQENLYINSTSRIYIKFLSLPELPRTAYITNATLNLYIIPDTIEFDGYIGVYNVTSNWNNTLTWNGLSGGAGAIADKYTDVNHVSYNSTYYLPEYTWNVTPIVKGWYNGTNYGLCLAPVDNTTTMGRIKLYSGSTDTEEYRPQICIEYRDMEGLEDYWSYTTQSAGFAGNGYVNNATGNLVFSIGTVGSIDGLMPIMPTLTYNAEMISPLNTNSPCGAFGAGMVLNISETITVVISDSLQPSKNCYLWRDGDGTQHGFVRSKSTGKYEDEDGLHMTLTVLDDGYEIKDGNKTVRHFNSSGQLTAIEDKSGNRVEFSLDSYGNPKAVKLVPNGLGAITQLEFIYNSVTCVLEEIRNVSSGDKVKLYYSSNGAAPYSAEGYLGKMEYIAGGSVVATATYTYDTESMRLTSVNNSLTNYTLNYSYNSAGRVIGVSESVGDSAGQSVTFSYGTSTTAVRTSGKDDQFGNADDLINNYVFDACGRTVSTYTTNVYRSKLYGATSGSYVDDNPKANNSLKTSVSTSQATSNWMLNGGFEQALSNWSFTGSVTTVSSGTERKARLTVNSATNTSELTQSVWIWSGTYNLSLKVGSANTQNARAYIEIEFLSSYGGRAPITKEIALDKFDALGGEIAESITFDTQNSDRTCFENIKVKIRLTGTPTSNVSIDVDKVMLTDSIGAADYDFVQFGNFENNFFGNGSEIWERGNNTNIVTPEIYREEFFGAVLKIDGSMVTDPSNDSQLTTQALQTVYVASEENIEPRDYYPSKLYKLSAWAKGTAQSYGADAKFCIAATIWYYNGTNYESDLFTLEFDKGINEWQFAQIGIVTDPTKGEVTDIDLLIDYSNNPGVAYFDSVSFVEGGGAESYDYAANGYVSSYRNNSVVTLYEYDNNDNLTRQKSSNGLIIEYTYDEKERVVSEKYSTFTGRYMDDELISPDEQSYTKYVYNSYGLCTSVTTYESEAESQSSSAPRIRTTTAYVVDPTQKIFGVVESETDGLNRMTRYFYDRVTGRVLATLYPNGEGVCYTYDAMGNITSVLPAQIEGGDSTYNFLYSSVTDSASVNYVYDEVTKRLSSIITQSTTYVFTYDAFGNTQNISASGNTLASYTYNANNGKLNTLTYGNGLSVKYVYDVLDRIEEIQYNIGEGNAFETVYSYEYDVNSRLHSVTDHRSGEVTVYVYDGAGRLTDTVIYDTETYKNVYSKYVIYDTESKVTAMSDKFDVVISNESQSMGISYQYTYDESDRVDLIFMGSEALLDYSYDSFSRLSIKSTFFGAFTLDQFYSYTSSGRNQSSQVASVETELRRGSANTLMSTSTTSYVYDSNGNITQILVNGELKNRYTYDDLGQLIREDNKALNKTYTWTYDRAGNITSKTTYTYTTVDNSALATSGNLIDVIAYTYSGDRLISYDGNAITYDTIGNPTSIQDGSNTISLTWEGRELKSYSSGDTSITYSYNADGIRTQKVVGTKTYDYIVDGSRIVAEKCGNEYLYIYIYDESGSPIGIKVRDNSQTDGEYTYYYFEKNIQGDIVAIYNESGTKIGRYTYDAWGVPTTTILSSVADERELVTNNPFRCRGYYYDIETGWYYLQSRYYDPEIGRWINADSQLNASLGVLGFNTFSYCLNDPVNKVDFCGNKPGDLFNTMDEAAKDAAIYLGALSFENGWEYITVIYSVDKIEKTYKTVTKTYRFLWWSWTRTSTKVTKTKVKKFTYKAVKTNKDPWSVNIPMAPLFRKRLATVHTHPMGSGQGITRFSKGDIKTSNSMGLVDYVYGPNGELRKYDPSTGEDILIYSDLPRSSKKPWLN